MITDLRVSSRQTVLDGKIFGSIGSYEQIHGSACFEIDPTAAANTRITDLDMAPRNANGRVECRADIWILRPTDPARANGALLYHVVNRGRKGILAMYNLAEGSNRPETPEQFGDGFLLEQGYTIAACAWQADVPSKAIDVHDLMTFDVPVATWNGETITGPVACEIVVDEPVDIHSLGDRYVIPHSVAEGTERAATLTVREKPYDEHRTVNRDLWFFDWMPDGRPAIRYSQDFAPGLIYNLVYTGRDPKIMGLGFAATRDFVTCLKYEALKDLPGDTRVDRAYAFGSSQSGRFLRHLLYEGFNEDEQRRKVFDGLIIDVAGGGMGSFNHRFAQPSRDASTHTSVFYPTEQFPFTDQQQTDPATGQTAGLLDRCEQTGSVPRIFYTNTSTEYWNRGGSLIHTDITATEDAVVHPSVRIYHFTGTQHGPADLPEGKDDLPGNPVNFRLGHRALLVALDQWVTEDKDPPPSRYGRIQDGTLIQRERLEKMWPKDRIALPRHPRDPRRLDYGTSWAKGIIDREPPLVGQSYPVLFPAIDKDGNEIPGIRLPEVAIPLGVFTGWRFRSETMGAQWAAVGLEGFWHRFSRRSIVERYPDRAAYVCRCREVAETLVSSRHLLEQDLPLIEDRAKRMYDWAVSSR